MIGQSIDRKDQTFDWIPRRMWIFLYWSTWAPLCWYEITIVVTLGFLGFTSDGSMRIHAEGICLSWLLVSFSFLSHCCFGFCIGTFVSICDQANPFVKMDSSKVLQRSWSERYFVAFLGFAVRSRSVPIEYWWLSSKLMSSFRVLIHVWWMCR